MIIWLYEYNLALPRIMSFHLVLCLPRLVIGQGWSSNFGLYYNIMELKDRLPTKVNNKE